MTNAIEWEKLPGPVLLRGDAVTAYRDPAAIYHEGVFHLFFTLVRTDAAGNVFLHLAKCASTDFANWTAPRVLTPADSALNYSSPGNMIRFDGKWVLCLQTYPRPDGEKYANEDARLWTMTSADLEIWDSPRLLRVKGPAVTREDMGRMIDPFLLEDRERAGLWWCFYKQNGVSISRSPDLETWEPAGRAEAGENACVLTDGGDYVLFHSPENGIGVKRSRDLKRWHDEGVFTLGQTDWPWARGRITAGFVLDLRHESAVGKAILFFHGSGPESEETMFDNFANIGFAWSDTLADWQWARPSVSGG